MSLNQEYLAYIAKVRARGDELVQYKCPDCKEQIETRAAPMGEQWDTLAACPHCNELHMKYTVGNFAYATHFIA